MADDPRRFRDKVVIVTGAASGIGLATAKRFGAEGAAVIIADLHSSAQAVDEVRKAGASDVRFVECDVSKEEQVVSLVDETIRTFGKFDVIVNCAGLMVFKPLVEHTTEDWMKILDVDLMGAFYFTKQALLKMKPGSAIVNVSSIHAEVTEPDVASYAAAKAALLSLTRSGALEGEPKGIRVNAILPGAIDTPMLWDNPNVKSGIESINRNDVGKPEDVAALIAFLASDDAIFVQGASVRIDGGRLDRL